MYFGFVCQDVNKIENNNMNKNTKKVDKNYKLIRIDDIYAYVSFCDAYLSFDIYTLFFLSIIYLYFYIMHNCVD